MLVCLCMHANGDGEIDAMGRVGMANTVKEL